MNRTESGKLRIDAITRHQDGQCSTQFRPADGSQDTFVIVHGACNWDMDLDYFMVLDPYYPQPTTGGE